MQSEGVGALHPALGTKQEGHGSAGVSPEEVTKVIRGLGHLCYEERQIRFVQPGKEKVFLWGHLVVAFCI